ncbi:MAG TPA: TerC family protein, partial [Ktedonobacteraceae bacterium]
MNAGGAWPWILFNLFVLLMLALDLGVFHRKAHAISLKEALTWSVVWIALAFAFNVGVFIIGGTNTGIQFFTGYLVEKSLSVDNIFIFVLLFTHFSIPANAQHRILFWGVLGALIMRGILIGLGSVLLESFHWIIYLFGAFLVFTGLRMIFQKQERIEPEKNPLFKLVRRVIPVTEDFEKGRFFVRRGGKLFATPMLLALVVIETTDLIFAVDSVPAVFAVATDPFIVYTSNVFALLGLRSLYFVFANVMHKFYYLKAA